MKRALFILAALLGTAVTSLSQVTNISVETFYTDNGSVSGYPTGHTTYRIYANTTNANDRVVVVSGNDVNPLVLNVSGSGIWNHNPGGSLGDDVNCTIYAIQPLAEYDSYMTIGYTCNNDGSLFDVYAAEDANAAWQNQLFATVPYGAGSVTVNSPVGATWFVLPTNTNSAAGADNKVLLAQITTDGDVCGLFNLQVFPNYSSPGDPYIVQNGLVFGSSGNCGTPGCTDPEAINYDSEAGYDNGLCLFDCAIEVADLSVSGPTCFGDNDGMISISGSGNQSYIEYIVNGDSDGLSGDGSAEFTGLANGTYTITLRDTRFDNEIANPGALVCEVTEVVEINTEQLFITSSVPVAVSCGGEEDGCVNTVPSNYGGGTGAVTYMIYNNANDQAINGSDNNPLVLPDPNYCGLVGGTYYFVATDENGCTAEGQNFNVISPATLIITPGIQTPASCFNTTDGIQVITWAGGTGDVDFSFEDDGIYEIEGNPSNAILNNLGAGTIMLYAQDDNGCTAEVSFDMTAGPEIIINPMVTSPSCNGDSDGSIAVMAGGGTGTLEFSFDGVGYSNVATLGELPNGSYMVYVRDANDCVASQEVDVVEPEVLDASADATDISCNDLADGTIQVSATGGTAPYAYSTFDGGYSPSSTLGNLSAGSYSVYVMDANDCMFVLNDAAVISEPSAIAASAVATAACFDECNGTIVMTTSGGAGSYTYSANGGTASSNSTISDLCADTYEVLVSDANGCQFVVSNAVVASSSEIVINGLSPDPINSDPGGNTPYSVSGGTAPYTYDWSGPGGFNSDDENLPDLTNDTQDGAYTLTVTDANGCSVSQTINVTGVSELGNEYSISMYPNPNNGQFLINILGMKGEKMTYSIVDAAGRVVFGKDLGNVNGTRIEDINVTNVAAGIYNVQFTIGAEIHSIRFVKN
jgi:hypothetical protein